MNTHRPSETSVSEKRQPWAALVFLALAQFMVVLDITVVNVALPSIGADLGFASADLPWVISAYVLFTGGFLLLGGRAADLFGRRRVFLLGLLTFTVASLASGLASSPEALIVARAAQGLGAALLSPAALSIITTTYHGSQRTTALSAWGAIGAGGAAAGVLFGGMLTAWLSWEWVFFINVPVGVGVAAATLRTVAHPTASTGRHRDLDLLGALVVTGGLVTIVYSIQQAEAYGWASARTLVVFGGGALLLAAFAALERSARSPLVPPATWRIRSLVSSVAMMLGATALLIGAFFLNSLYLQQVLGWSALETGLAFLPFAAIIGVAAHAAPRLLAHMGSRGVVLAGLALSAVGALGLAAASAQASYTIELLPGLLAMGAGIGLVFVTISITAMSEIGPDRAGLASGLMQTSHEIGAAVGVALMSMIAVTSGTGTITAAGYADGFLASALLAAVLALIAVARVPAGRPVATAGASLH